MTKDDNTSASIGGFVDADIAALRLFTLHSPVAAAMLDRELHYLCVNARWLDNLGLGEADVVGRSLYDAFPDLGAEWRDVHRRCLAGEAILCEADRSERDGRTSQWSRWQVRPWHRADGSIGGIFIFTVDISRAISKTEALAQRERLFEALFRDGPVGVAVSTPDGICLQSNKALQQMLGYTEAEMRGQPFSKFTHAEDIPASLERVKQLRSGQMQRSDLEQRYVRKDGSTVYANTLLTQVRGPGGEFEAHLAIVRDITEQKRAEQALRDSEQRFQTLFAQAPIGIAMLDGSNRYQLVNQAMQDILGRTESEMRGHHFSEFTHPDDLAECRRQEAGMEAGTLPRMDVVKRYRRKDGSVVHVNSIVTRVRDAASGTELRLAIARDITRQKQAEQALRESEQLFRTLFERAPYGIFLSDADQKYLRANEALQRMLGYSEAEIVGGKYTKFTHPDDLEASNRLTTRVLAGETDLANIDKRYIRKDGSILYANTTLTAVRTPEGALEYYLAMAIDIGERRRIEEALERGRRLQAVGEVAGTIAHDFNNLLAIIVGNLELAEAGIRDEATRQLVARALAAANAGASFNQRLLSLTARGRLDPIDLSVSERARDICKLLEQTIGGRIDIRRDLPADLWPVHADCGEVDSALINLCLNARDAMPAGGTLSVTTRNLSLGADAMATDPRARPGDYVQLSVSDTGVGMSSEVLQRAGEPFFTTKVPGRGTGLGLASVHNFVHRAGGFVSIDSRPGDGTTVRLHLPRATTVAAALDAGEAGESPHGNGELVLVVEDDPVLRELTLKRLEALGYAVLEAASAETAMAQIDAGEPVALVISDIVMPGAHDGYDLARWLADRHPAIRVLLASDHDDPPPDGEERASNWPFLAKPYTRERLARAVRQALDAPLRAS
jgi:PAS domain S-box-containing protein